MYLIMNTHRIDFGTTLILGSWPVQMWRRNTTGYLKATLPLPVRGGTHVRDSSWNLDDESAEDGVLCGWTYGSELCTW